MRAQWPSVQAKHNRYHIDSFLRPPLMGWRPICLIKKKIPALQQQAGIFRVGRMNKRLAPQYLFHTKLGLGIVQAAVFGPAGQ
jgi:hypothetical protein